MAPNANALTKVLIAISPMLLRPAAKPQKLRRNGRADPLAKEYGLVVRYSYIPRCCVRITPSKAGRYAPLSRSKCQYLLITYGMQPLSVLLLTC